jgi:hypothetical protein
LCGGSLCSDVNGIIHLVTFPLSIIVIVSFSNFLAKKLKVVFLENTQDGFKYLIDWFAPRLLLVIILCLVSISIFAPWGRFLNDKNYEATESGGNCSELKGKFMDMCFSNQGKCENVVSDDEKNGCYAMNAIKVSNVDLCNLISNSYTKASCVDSVNLRLNKCEAIVRIEERAECFSKKMWQTKEKRWCDFIDVKVEGTYSKEQCVERFINL